MNKLLLTVLSLFVINIEVSPQGEFVPMGADALVLTGDYTVGNDITGYSGGLIFAIRGLVDLGISYKKFEFSEQLLNSDLSGTAYIPSISIHPLKQNDTIPTTVSLTVSYQIEKYSNSTLDNAYLDMTGTNFSFGVLAGKYYEISPFFRIQPSFGFSYSIVKTRIKDSDAGETYQGVYNIGLPLVFTPVSWSMFIIYPQIGIFNRYPPVYSISLSYIVISN